MFAFSRVPMAYVPPVITAFFMRTATILQVCYGPENKTSQIISAYAAYPWENISMGIPGS
jgi:hypothetical protein